MARNRTQSAGGKKLTYSRITEECKKNTLIPEVRAAEHRQGATKCSKNNVNWQVSALIAEPTNCMSKVIKEFAAATLCLEL